MHPREEELNDYVDGALHGPDLTSVERHLEQCAGCTLIVAQLRRITDEAAALGPLVPPPGAWQNIKAGIVEPARKPSPAGRFGMLEWNPAWALAAAACLVAAFLAGRTIEQRHQRSSAALSVERAAPGRQDVSASSEARANTRERVLLVAVGDHLERSQIILVELANADTHGELDISAERQSAEELLASNRLYRQTAVQLGQANVAGVLDDLERVLVEVARGPSQLSMRQLAEIQRRIEAQGILFKVKVVNASIAGKKLPVS